MIVPPNNGLGQKFHKLTVIGCGKTPGIWVVQCDCGVVKPHKRYEILNGKVTTCGSGWCRGLVKDLTGKVFGQLTVIGLDHMRRGASIWKCLCSCSNITYVPAGALGDGNTRSCGCLQKTAVAKTRALPFGEAILNKIFREYKRVAKDKRMVFSLSFNEFVALISDCCHYCDIAPCHKMVTKNTLIDKGKCLYVNGIDRKDNNVGYSIENSITACTECNFAKGSRSYNDFIMWIERTWKNQANWHRIL